MPDGSGAIWVSVGVGQAQASQFEWSDPTKLEGQDPVTVSRSNVLRRIPWDSATNGWVSQRNLYEDVVTWYRGATVLDAIRVKLDTRPGSNGQGQCRMELSGVGSSPPVKVGDNVIPAGTFTTGWTNAPCEHSIEVEQVICTFRGELGERPAAGRGPTVFMSWTTGTAYVVGDVILSRFTVRQGEVSVVSYRCTSAHTGSSSNRPGRGASWQTYWTRIY